MLFCQATRQIFPYFTQKPHQNVLLQDLSNLFPYFTQKTCHITDDRYFLTLHRNLVKTDTVLLGSQQSFA
jgi:hypothetical protein